MGTLTNRNFTDQFLKCRNSHKSQFHRSNSKVVGLLLLEKFS
ncbi:hypothetical protein LEP1GSC132_2158 [Leptospira kirschneri str. 200803703]|uniref:Uncharacterized protein n=1 Tax=Leptospira kirschneri str. 200802841 TaxID=1193047 RepID=A0A828XX12_9LEPT|nr:hypothetical protein LEP1GSC131_1215 [Leptospira kirschneri str. 200802841]EMO65470.1 hypothetical protein LEP1GSC132_2158 [Leptospira kirschneri str. 200803703]EMO77743.1 hypothetical protein LEP1GSC127_1503 [Leptospira kirschneri str. 200801925]